MINFRYIVFILIVAVLIFLMIDCNTDSKANLESKKPRIALSTFSLYDIAKHISADTFDLFTILPAGVDAHSFEPTPRLMVNIDKSELVVYSGAGLEPWISNFDFKSKVIDMSKHVKLIGLDKNDEHKHAHSSSCSHSTVDPHYWLDIQNMTEASNILTEEFIKIIPSNKKLYIQNRDTYIAMLNKLDSDYKKELSQCKIQSIIVNHNAFSYLAEKYSFSVESLSGLSPDTEPNAKSMLRLIQHVREDNISTIFFESFVSDIAMKSIAKEVNIEVDVLHPLGNITANDLEKNLNYEDIMRINLQKISKARECR